jgi:GNAT superfamily N-acetyltransferase
VKMATENMTVVIEGPLLGQAGVCAPILAALPEWFAYPEAVAQYLRDIEGMPTLLARLDEKVVGFLNLKAHSPYAAEVNVMGVLVEYHRHGVGRALLQAAHAHQAKAKDYTKRVPSGKIEFAKTNQARGTQCGL